MQLSNYLFFTTTCQQALEFYAECGLGQITEVMFYGANNMPVKTESMCGKIMHAKFEGPGVCFFASDNDDAEPMRGSAQIMMTNDRALTERFFTCLGVGGNVTTQLAIQPWGDYYGKLTDRFGVQWMFNCTPKL
jgi:PhnB protein